MWWNWSCKVRLMLAPAISARLHSNQYATTFRFFPVQQLFSYRFSPLHHFWTRTFPVAYDSVYMNPNDSKPNPDSAMAEINVSGTVSPLQESDVCISTSLSCTQDRHLWTSACVPHGDIKIRCFSKVNSELGWPGVKFLLFVWEVVGPGGLVRPSFSVSQSVAAGRSSRAAVILATVARLKHGWKMLRIVQITLLLGLVLYTGAKPSYNVVAPRTIRPNTNYFVAISVDGTDGELQVGNAVPIMNFGLIQSKQEACNLKI